MEIRRKVSVVQRTDRRIVIRYSPDVVLRECAECGSKMLPVENIVDLFDLTASRIRRILEDRSVHFTKDGESGAMICLLSMAGFLESG